MSILSNIDELNSPTNLDAKLNRKTEVISIAKNMEKIRRTWRLTKSHNSEGRLFNPAFLSH